MTQEEKQLVLKDFCARLPYHTKCYNISTEEDFELSDVTDIDTGYPSFDYGYAKIEDIKPYLRSMSSMTEEEKEGYNNARSDYYDDLETYDWLNEHHFDYRGLIEKGLALEAPKNMYNTKKQ